MWSGSFCFYGLCSLGESLLMLYEKFRFLCQESDFLLVSNKEIDLIKIFLLGEKNKNRLEKNIFHRREILR